jgi:Arc/MetJ-type ribon-helix-helix transcriptional regulator
MISPISLTVSAIIPDPGEDQQPSSTSRSERVSGRLDPALLERMDEAVRDEGLRNRSDFLRRAVTAYLETLGESGDGMVRVSVPMDQLAFMRQLVELGEAESISELVRAAVKDHIRALPRDVRERNELLAYYREARELREREGYRP